MRSLETPRISVVVPCRDESARFEACLDALAAQELPAGSFEVIVVDGSSRDGSRSIALAQGARILSDEGRGPASARNMGIRAARGDIVAFTDADCVPRFDWLARIEAAFAADPDVAAVAGGLRMPRETLLGRLEDNDARVHYRGYITSNIAYRRRVLEEVGGFDERLVCAEDHDLAWRVLDAGYRIAHDPQAIVLHNPPELESARAYIAKQFWYARQDVPAHARAVLRVLRAEAGAPGSERAIRGFGEALRRTAWLAAIGAGAAVRSPGLVAGTLAAAMLTSGIRVAQTIAAVGDQTDELPRMTVAETAKKLARGAGLVAGLADLTRPSARATITSGEGEAWTRRPADLPARVAPAA